MGHYETVGNLLDAVRGLRLYKPPAIRDISPHIVPATGRTVLALSSSEACFTVGPAALRARTAVIDDDGCAVVADAAECRANAVRAGAVRGYKFARRRWDTTGRS